MAGDGLNIGSRTKRWHASFLRFSKPTMVNEWPGGDVWLRAVTGECREIYVPGCWKYRGGSDVRHTFLDWSVVPLEK